MHKIVDAPDIETKVAVQLFVGQNTGKNDETTPESND